MKLTLYFAIGLTIFMVVPHLALTDDLVEEPPQPNDPTAESGEFEYYTSTPAPTPTDYPTTITMAGDYQSETETEDQKQSSDDESESDPKSDDSTESKGDDQSGNDELVGTTTPSDDQSGSEEEPKTDDDQTNTDPSDTESPERTVQPDAEVTSQPEPEEPTTQAETESPNEPVTESPEDEDQPEPMERPKISFWHKLKSALSPKSPYFYLFIGVFGFIFVAILIFAYSRLFIHPQQSEEYDISSRAERGPDNPIHETLQLDYFRTTTVTLTA